MSAENRIPRLRISKLAPGFVSSIRLAGRGLALWIFSGLANPFISLWA